MNHKDKALRIAYKAFISLHRGESFNADEYKTLADLCGIALPMKYRFSRDELRAMKHPSFLETPDGR